MSDFEVKGAEQFLRLSKALKQAGDTELRKALHKGLRDAVKAAMPEAEQKLAENLPYLRRGKAVRQVTQVRTGRDPGITVGVRFGSKRATNARLANSKGVFRHPVFGTDRWVNQPVPGALGWFDKTYENAAPDIRRELERVLEDVAEQVVNKARR